MNKKNRSFVINLAVTTALLIAIAGVWATNSFSDVSAAGRAGVNRVPTLFKDKDEDHGNGKGQGQSDDSVSDDQPGNSENKGQDGSKGEDKSNNGKSEGKGNDDNSDRTPDADDGEDGSDDGSGNVDCNDPESMADYIVAKSMNGAVHANENGADNAALGALNKCSAPGQQTTDAALASASTPESPDSTTAGDEDVSVVVDIDEDGNGTIEYDLDGDGEIDLILTVEDGIVVDSEETGSLSGDDGTPAASPTAA